MTRPRLLDLFCCEGGAGMGYHRAGFDVVGVDIVPQPRYPFDFVQSDALEFLAEHGSEFDAIHASPPCQDHSALNGRHGIDHGTGDLVPATRDLLVDLGRPWVMENVPGAPMPAAVMLCGSMFGLGAVCADGVRRQLRRHRLFEHHEELTAWPPYSCSHRGQAIGVYGHGGTTLNQKGRAANAVEARQALGVDWMSMAGMSQSIPPAYTEWLGAALLDLTTASRRVM